MAEIHLGSNHRLPTHCLSGLGKMLPLWASSVKWGHLPHTGLRSNGRVPGGILLALLAVTGGASDSKMRKLRSREIRDLPGTTQQ